ncbi:ribosomal protein L52 [Nesidiocoris tenuis]|uniref:Large ribosomal subunit protein mL52 n=1 Tax=Nesidiocoris tenuis TaxID=355587 RepID=A0ABN7B988_9HEMI|nr:ribosomal protein L52 [Nesidiocoris tenuis]
MIELVRWSGLLKARAVQACGLQFRLLSGGRLDAEPFMNRNHRRRNILSKNVNQCHQLREGPDYTFADGRATPYGSRQLARFQKQREYTEKIIKLTREVDMAKSFHKRQQMEKAAEIKQIIDSKLKAKGQVTLDT